MDLSTDISPVASPDAPTDSTAVDGRGGTQESPQHKPSDRDDAIAKAMEEAGVAGDNEIDDEPADHVEEKPEPKPAEEPKEEKPQEAEKPKDEAPVAKPEKPKHPDAPQNFLPRAKELWVNVPNEVKGEVHRIVADHEAELTRYREAIQPLARFDQMARESGTSLPDALERYTGMENVLRTKPTEGMRALLANMQMEPQHAIGHILRAFNVSPQALADHIAQAPEAYFQHAQQQRQQPQEDPRVAQLEQRLNEMQQQSVVRDVWEPFIAENPRAEALMPAIVQILKSGMVPASITDPRQRLEVAHDMAARLNPSAPYVEEATSAEEDDEDENAPRRAAKPSAANKSVRGAPNGGLNPARTKKGVSKDDAIRLALSEIGYS